MASKLSREVDLGKEPIGSLLFTLAVPAITSQVVNVLYTMVDRMYIGHIEGIGATALTGVGVAFPIISLCRPDGNGRCAARKYPDGKEE